MTQVTVSEFRKHLPLYLSIVDKGEDVQITRHGQVVALVSAPLDRRALARRDLDVLRSKARIGDVISPIEVDWEIER
jgi:prevent-host-death family protein